MPTLIHNATRVQAAGNLPKIIDEYIGRLNSGEGRISIAHMRSPAGWEEPGQTPEFEEYTVVLHGRLRVRHRNGIFDVQAGQAIITCPGEWISVLHSRRRRRVHRHLPSCIFSGYRPSRSKEMIAIFKKTNKIIEVAIGAG